MQKEMTVFMVCVLTLIADVLYLWQILSLRLNDKLFIDSFYGGTVLAVLILLALCLIWISSILIGKIIKHALN
jgi:hypothetical protein